MLTIFQTYYGMIACKLMPNSNLEVVTQKENLTEENYIIP